MNQLPLDLPLDVAPSFSNLVDGPNVEALTRIRQCAAGERAFRFFYLWGLSGCGRSHVARALTAGQASRLILPDSSIQTFAGRPDILLHVADDVQAFDAARQEWLFHLYNHVQAHPELALVVTGDAPPMALDLREDLRTRLGWGLVYELRPLDDDARLDALQRHAAERGVTVSPDVLPWLLVHQSRDMRTLLALFDALDRHAYALRRPITLPLVRDWLLHHAA